MQYTTFYYLSLFIIKVRIYILLECLKYDIYKQQKLMKYFEYSQNIKKKMILI